MVGGIVVVVVVGALEVVVGATVDVVVAVLEMVVTASEPPHPPSVRARTQAVPTTDRMVGW